jgi:hypothetical protein
MNKRKLHHAWTRLRILNPWYFVALAVICTLVASFALRANNEHMIKLRDAVYAADKNNTDVQAPLRNLQAYVTTHMNTNLSAGPNAVYPPVQLKYTYDRLVTAQSDQLAQSNTALYTDAQHFCEQQNSADFSGRNRVPCIEQYVQSHGGIKLQPIADDLYKFSFESPVWSPDFAGWSVLVAVLAWLICLAVLVARLWVRMSLRK